MKKLLIGLTAAAVLAGAAGCNSDSEYDMTLPSSVMVTSFSLTDDDKVLSNLDSVFFSIDLNKGLIFNADSMPYGTKTDKLIPVIVTGGVSAAQLIVTRPGKADTVYNYLENSTDSIDFSNGPVTLRLQSLSGSTTKDYKIYVNVHKVKGDSLVWNRLERTSLPSLFGVVNSQQTVKSGNTIYCLTKYDNRYSMASSDDPVSGEWNKTEVTFAFRPVIASLSATDDALYILDESKHLYRSVDGGNSWTATGVSVDHIYGGYETTLICGRTDGSRVTTVEYPSMKTTLMPAGFPASATSMPIKYSFEMSTTPQLMIVGGRLPDNSMTAATWSYDGSAWACVGKGESEMALGDMTVVPYFAFSHNNAWVFSKYSVLLAFGGFDKNNKNQKTTYISYDYGATWRRADTMLQLPDYVPAMRNARGFIVEKTMKADAADAQSWKTYPPVSLRSGWSFVDTPVQPVYGALSPLVSEPVVEWECPYIYVFGGEGDQSQTYNTVWRAVINRLTFKPII